MSSRTREKELRRQARVDAVRAEKARLEQRKPDMDEAMVETKAMAEIAKPLRSYRSEAERTRVRQGYVQIVLTVATLVLVWLTRT